MDEHVAEGTQAPAADPDSVSIAYLPTPRAGELSTAWRFGSIALWVGVVLAWSAIWNASVQLGLSTWWLGPRGEPTPAVVRLLPFVAPAAMLLAIINNVRWAAYGGVVAAAALAAIAIGDLGRVQNIGRIELAVAITAGVASLASLAGTYRHVKAPTGAVGR
ncbi:MAG TPA: hypothetical protein VMM60_06880 [Ilumatobacter sp.]|nr:hypothetical protein [Ilumatobacter sp.]